MKKKLLSVLLTAAMAATLLAFRGCAGGRWRHGSTGCGEHGQR